MDHLLWYWSRFQQAFAIDVYLRQKIKSSQRSNLEARLFSTGSIAVSGQKFDPSPIVPWRHPQDCQMRSLQGQQRAPAAPMADGRCLIHIWKLKPLKLVWLQVLLGGEMEVLRCFGCWMGFFRVFGMLCGWFRGMFFPLVSRWYCLVMILFFLQRHSNLQNMLLFLQSFHETYIPFTCWKKTVASHLARKRNVFQ